MFIASSIGAGEDFSSYATDGQANGRYWNVLSQTDKFAFITGVDEAITTCAEIELAYIEGGTDTKEREKRRSLFRYFAATSPEEVTLAELIKQIDDYYSKEENLDTPIMSIYFRMTADKKASSEKK